MITAIAFRVMGELKEADVKGLFAFVLTVILCCSLAIDISLATIAWKVAF